MKKGKPVNNGFVFFYVYTAKRVKGIFNLHSI